MPTFIYFTPEKDAYISEYYANSNFGDVPYLYTNNVSVKYSTPVSQETLAVISFS